MDNESINTAPMVPVATPRKRRSVVRVIIAMLGCLLLAVLATMWVAKERAQAQFERAKASEFLAYASQEATAQASNRVRDAAESSFQPQVVKMVPQTIVDPTTGNVITRMMAVPVAAGSLTGTDNNASDSFRNLESEIQQLANKARNSPPEQRQGLIQSITKKLDELFEARHNEQSSKIKKLAAELQQSQAMLDRRMELKSKIIDRRLKELTGQPDELNWNAAPLKLDSSATTPSPNAETTSPAPGMLSDYVQYQTQSILPNQSNVSSALTPWMQPLGDPVQSSATPLASQPLAPSPTVPAPSLPNLVAAPSSMPSIGIPLPERPAVNDPNEATKSENPRQPEQSFLQLGIKLKKLVKSANPSDNDEEIKRLQSEISDVREMWDFEKMKIKTELTQTNSELAIVKRQIEISEEDYRHLKSAFDSGRRARSEVSEAEFKKSEVELQKTQVEGKLAKLQQSIDWMDKLERDVFESK